MRPDRQRRESREFFGPFEGIGKSADAVNTTLDVKLFGGVDAGAEQHVPRNGPSEFVARTLDRPLINRQTELRCRNAESADGSGHTQVAGKGQLGSGTHRGAIDRRNGDARKFRESPQGSSEGVAELVTLDSRQIGTRTKRRGLAREHHDARATLDAALVLDHRTQGREINRIAAMRTTNRDDRNVITGPFKSDGWRIFAHSAGEFLVIRLYHRQRPYDFRAHLPLLAD